MRRRVAVAVVMAVAGLWAPLRAQTLGTFRWQLRPFCNVITVTVVQQGAQYHIDGTDDQCGAARQASVVGRAFPNPDGTIGFGLTTVTTTGAAPVHLDVRLSIATLGGTWTDSAGNSGSFVFTPGAGSGGSARPVPPGGIAPGSITAAQLAPGSVTAAQLAPGAVSGAVGALGTCPAGQTLRGFVATGPVCDPVTLPPTTTLVDSGPASTGDYTSIAIGRDGVPIISHRVTGGLLRVTHCNNPSCTSATSTTVDALAGVGVDTSLAIGADGLAIISHWDLPNDDLRVTHCSNVACTEATSTSVDTAGSAGSSSSLAIGSDGLAVIAHHDVTNRDLRVTHCNDAACSTATSTTVATDDGYYPSIAIGANGRAVISYQSLTELRLAFCVDISCTTATAITMAPSPNGTGGTAIALSANGSPVIAWSDDDDESRVTRCADPACSSAETVFIGEVGGVSIAFGSDGLAVISGQRGTTLLVTHCSVASCQTYTQVTVDAGGELGANSSIAIGTDGLPVISYRDETNRDLRVAKCNSRTCQ